MSLRASRAGRALLETFEAIRIINLRSRDDRRREIIAEFDRLGLAIGDAQTRFHEASRFDSAEPFPLIGAKGCYVSHLRILEEAKLNRFANVLILEDDCDFTSGIETTLPLALKALQTRHWNFFYGGHDDVLRNERSETPIHQIKSGTWVRGTHFVALDSQAINAIVPFLYDEMAALEADPNKGSKGIDAAYTHFGRRFDHYKYYVAWPKLSFQRPSRTDISAQSVFDQNPIFSRFMPPARRVKRYIKKLTLR